MAKPRVTRVKLEQEFAVRGDGGIHELGADVTVLLRGRIVGVEDEVAEVTAFGVDDKQFISTGVRIVRLLPIGASLVVPQ